MGDDSREAFTEDALGTEAVLTAEAARPEFEADGDAVPREVGDVARVVAVNTCRRAAAARALNLLSGRLDDQCQRAVTGDDLL